MTAPLSADFADLDGRTWLNTAHQGALPGSAAAAARTAVEWKTRPYELTMDRFQGIPARLREALANLVNGPIEQIVLGNSASYGLHLIANAYPWRAGDEVLVMAGDFPSDVLPWLTLRERYGVRVHRIRPRARVVTADELAAAITDRTRLFCTTWVHSFSGHVADLDALGEVCREHGVWFVVNGSQGVGARPIDVTAAPIDALISVGFKWLCGPVGTGFTWLHPRLRERLTRVKAYWLAQLSQADLARDDLEVELPAERGPYDLDIFGTANFFNFLPWTVAVEHVNAIGVRRIAEHNEALVARLVERLPESGARLLDAESALVYFSHADRGRNARLHATLAEAGVDVAFRGGTLRASPHLYNTFADIDRLVDTLAEGGDPC